MVNILAYFILTLAGYDNNVHDCVLFSKPCNNVYSLDNTLKQSRTALQLQFQLQLQGCRHGCGQGCD